MSTDKRVTKDIIETLEDSRKGFTDAAQKLRETDRADLAARFDQFANERAQFSQELERMAQAYGDDIDESGSLAGAAHRGWMAVKDAISGSDAEGVLEAAEQGEDHAVSEYEDALAKDDLSAELRAVLERQFSSVKEAHDAVRSARDAARAS